MENTINDLARYFQSSKKALTYNEFLLFWMGLSPEEVFYYRNVDLKTGLLK